MITNAIKRAYDLRGQKYPLIFWKIDLHGVCFQSNYVSNEYNWVNDACLKALMEITNCPHSKIILWSSCYDAEQKNIINFFNKHGIRVDFFNENPLFANTDYGCFDKKFYFSILIDDKAGFDPHIHWEEIYHYMITKDNLKDE